jgi:hypothetical protein
MMLKRLALAFSPVRRFQEENAKIRENLQTLQATLDRLATPNRSIKRQDVVLIYLDLLGRTPENEGVVQYYLAKCHTVDELYDAVRASPEYAAHIARLEEAALSATEVAAEPQIVDSEPVPPPAAIEPIADKHPLAPWPFLYTPQNAPFFSHREIF